MQGVRHHSTARFDLIDDFAYAAHLARESTRRQLGLKVGIFRRLLSRGGRWQYPDGIYGDIEGFIFTNSFLILIFFCAAFIAGRFIHAP